MERLSPQVLERINGPSWDEIRPAFLRLTEILLNVDPTTYGQLTTIYVKYTLSAEPSSPVYAVAWIKTSKQVVVGLSLPESTDDPLLGQPPAGTKYKGLTKYFLIRPGDSVPERLSEWARTAHEFAAAQHRKEAESK